MLPENCGILLSLSNDISAIVGDNSASLILFGSSLDKGCNKESDIDLLLLVHDNVFKEGLFRGISEVIKQYEANGYVLSLNLLPVSDFIKKLVQGDSFAVKIVNTGYPITGVNLYSSLKKLAEKLPVAQNKEQLINNVVSMVNDAGAILEASKRDLFIVCGNLKSAMGYVLTLTTGIEDPEVAVNKADREVSEIYLALKGYCKQALRGHLPPSVLEDILRRVRETVKVLEKFL
ncbi:nucleotidyltransferase domain-containing protein [Saccharolobus shibatae]|uniref:Polymerase nucleotidyl transferase domain-containing protein n=1 Tax=Saccharolobus shibatae TaxID=2286 RepID=A0A8F5BX49_9CREN|nr:nucleotidyltransferase domain-containing protein [Saccharolobus shibatae]QXJ32995.1 hypothetical protein J5U21_02655 [Saccharolobus shibatae]